MEFVYLLQEFGPLAGLVLLFILREWRREDRLNKRILALESEHKEVVLPLLSRALEVITENTLVMKEVKSLLEPADGKRESAIPPSASSV